MTKTIEDFIKLGWHTVPLAGKLTRLENGKKTTPAFEKNWLAKYTKEFNEKATDIGGAVTGKMSNIIAIDCDNTVTYRMLRALDPSYDFIFVSLGKKDAVGKDIEAGTFVYNYVEELDESYVRHDGVIDLDFLSNGRFTYLPTEYNKTKEPFTLNGKQLKDPPEAIIALIKSLKPIAIERSLESLEKKVWQNHLAPQVERFVKTKKVIPELFRVLTPYDFRDTDSYLDKGYLEPDDVADGRGSEYLSKISAILGADESIDIELYIEAMEVINQLFSQPIPKTRLSATVIEPMVEERSSINGVPIWKYNESWADNKLQVVTKRNSMLDAFYDPDRMIYYTADVMAETVKQFVRDSDFQSYLEAVTFEPPNKKEAKARMPLVDVTSSPAHDFGFFTSQDVQAFNIFSPSKALRIFRNPKVYAKNYSRPDTIISYLESLVPDNYMRNYLLRFLRRKFDKFEYSPVILYFLGVSGAGKDRFVNLIEKIIGSASLSRPTTNIFLDMYNGWMLDKYFVQLDEYGGSLSKYTDQEEALGRIKAYTGKAEVSIRTMRTDSYEYRHAITFIMTANKNPLFLDADDRRVALFNCPNPLKDEQWVQEAGGVSEVLERMDNEIYDFAYYLAISVDNVTRDEYTQPPETEDKKLLIASKFSAGMKISFMLKNNMFAELEEIARDLDVKKAFDGAAEGRIFEDDLFDLYYEMTDGKGTKRGLTTVMKEFDKLPTTRDGQKAYYYNIPSLRGYRPGAVEPITPEEAGFTGV